MEIQSYQHKVMKDKYYPQIEISGDDILKKFSERQPHFNVETMNLLRAHKIVTLRNSFNARQIFVSKLRNIFQRYNIGKKDLLYAFPDSNGNIVVNGSKYKSVGSPNLEYLEGVNGSALGIAIFGLLQTRLADIRKALKDSKKESQIPMPHSEKELSFVNFSDRPSSVIDSRCKNLILTNGVEQISARACQYCNALVHVTFPNTLKIIRKEAFWGCSLLSMVTIPGSVKIIENNAFEDCKNLKQLSIEKGLIKIGDFAFYGCDLRSLNIPGSVRTVGNQAFCHNDRLSTVTIGDGMQIIGNGAFANKIVKRIEVPGSIKMIEGMTFDKKHPETIDGITTYVPKIKEISFSFMKEKEREL